VRHHRLDFSNALAWTVDDVLTAAECDALIERTEAIGYSAAPVTTARGPVHLPDVRNNERVMLDDPGLAGILFERLRFRVPASLELPGGSSGVSAWRAVGANERLRFYRYGPGQRFAPHHDGAFVRDAGEQSFITLMVYLNDGFEGGETRFLDLERTVVPRTGSALLFQHGLLHEGAAVTRGTKYVIRSDVMYVRWRPDHAAASV